jgi:hypothetical protein
VVVAVREAASARVDLAHIHHNDAGNTLGAIPTSR